jgi:hypothetical protein
MYAGDVATSTETVGVDINKPRGLTLASSITLYFRGETSGFGKIRPEMTNSPALWEKLETVTMRNVRFSN